MTESKAMIVGCAGKFLSEDEIAFLTREKPWGLILFARNIGMSQEIADLTAHFRMLVGREDAPVFIDQEGGRVQRIKPPVVRKYPPGADIGALYDHDPVAGKRAAWLMSRLHAADLLPLGITADCLPVLDVPVSGSHDVIGNRAYSHDPETVTILGREAARGLADGGVMPVIKHMPGHGRASSDSHKQLPVVKASLEELRRHDFPPFEAMNDLPMAMTAHIVFTAIDPQRPATASPLVVQEIIRGELGFDGLLMSDDVSMEALSGDFGTRAETIFGAGCDVVLHCNGVMDEMLAVAANAPILQGKAAERAQKALDWLHRTDGRVGDAEYLASLHDEMDGFFAAAA